jgi:hypothetical protein
VFDAGWHVFFSPLALLSLSREEPEDRRDVARGPPDETLEDELEKCRVLLFALYSPTMAQD